MESDETLVGSSVVPTPIIGAYGKRSKAAIEADFAACEKRIRAQMPVGDCGDPTCGCVSAPRWFDTTGKCDGCGKVRDRVIRRNLGSNGQPPRMLCDACFEAAP